MQISYRTRDGSATIKLTNAELRQFMSQSVAVEAVREAVQRAININGGKTVTIDRAELANFYHTARIPLAGQRDAAGRSKDTPYERKLIAARWYHEKHPDIHLCDAPASDLFAKLFYGAGIEHIAPLVDKQI